MKTRRTYPLRLTVNGRMITEVIIDPHYEEKHPEMSDFLILRVVKLLGGEMIPPGDRKGAWDYFDDERALGEVRYRLVWCMEQGQSFLGVINFRR